MKIFQAIIEKQNSVFPHHPFEQGNTIQVIGPSEVVLVS